MNISRDILEVDNSLFQQEELILEATELLSTIMAENDISKADLARRLGKTNAFVTQCLSGGQNLTLRTLANLFGALGYRLDLGATPHTREICQKIVRLYSVGGWALEKTALSVYPKCDLEESSENSGDLLLCEAA